MLRETREFPLTVPRRMQGLPIDRRGYPVPKFVEWIEGQPDFRVTSATHFAACVRRGACWICGELVGVFKAFVVGPMCCINRISAEPPSHYDCARFSASACPFLTRPKAVRREAGLPENIKDLAGVALKHNPGLAAIWVTKDYRLMRVDSGYLFRLGLPERVEFYAHGRHATREEVEGAIAKGLPSLISIAERDGPQAMKELEQSRNWFERRIDQWTNTAH